MRCRFVNTGCNDAYTNMAIDEAILACCQEPTLRVYQWSSPSISLGYSQNVKEGINAERCRQNGIAVVRRITGGKAVLHDREVTYSFIAPESAIKLPRDVTTAYKIIANALVIALEKVGISAEIKNYPDRIATPACFNSSNWYELTVNNKKISGSAQRRLNGKILQHGDVLLDFDYSNNALLLNPGKAPNSAEKLKKELEKRVTSIKHELNFNISPPKVAAAIKEGFKKNFKLSFYEGKITAEEAELSETLKNEKYSTAAWNFGI